MPYPGATCKSVYAALLVPKLTNGLGYFYDWVLVEPI